MVYFVKMCPRRVSKSVILYMRRGKSPTGDLKTILHSINEFLESDRSVECIGRWFTITMMCTYFIVMSVNDVSP